MAEDKRFAQRWEEHQQWWDEFQPSKSLWLWSCVASVLLTIFVGFYAGGWVTMGAAKEMAAQAAVACTDTLVNTLSSPGKPSTAADGSSG